MIKHLFVLAVFFIVGTVEGAGIAYAHGCGGHTFSCHKMPNGTFWSYSDVLNIAGAFAMSSIIAIVGLKYLHLTKKSLHFKFTRLSAAMTTFKEELNAIWQPNL